MLKIGCHLSAAHGFLAIGFANGIRILEPSHLVDFMKMKLERAVDKYK
jgi:predicted DNA-binding transcriptional regulator YafY